MSAQEEFINTIGPIIKKYAFEMGYKAPSAIIAQACLESAYGVSSLAYKYKNYFGMKCGSSWKGKSVNLKTKEEYTVGTLTTIRDNFRVYDSMEEGVKGYFDFISTKRYENLKGAINPKQYLELIKQDGYATSSSYVKNCMNIVDKYNLYRFDSVTSFKEITPELIFDVIAGKYGHGKERENKLTTLGYHYESVRKKINELNTIAKKHKEAIVKEVGDYTTSVVSLIELMLDV